MRVKGPDGKVIEFPDGTPPEQVKSVMAKHYGGPSGVPGVSPMVSNTGPTQSDPGFQRRMAETIPSAGGLAGGALGLMVGGFPGAIGGAAAGGALGEGIKERVLGESLSALKIAKAGAVEGGLQAAGGVLSKGAGAVARPLMRRALGVGKAINGRVKIGKSRFPDPVETTLREGIPVSPKGAAKATELSKAANKEVDRLLGVAKLQGRTFKTADITKYARQLLRDRSLEPSEVRPMVKKLVEFLQDKGKKVDPELLRDIKQKWSDFGDVKVATSAEKPMKRFSDAMAKGARKQMATVPGVRDADAKLQALMGAERAVDRAVSKPPAGFELFRPGTYPMVSRLFGADVLSHSALGLDSPWFKEFARQSPRAAAQLVQQMMLSAESDATAVGQ